MAETKTKVSKKLETKGKQIGVVSNFFEHVKVAAIKLEKPLKVGDKIRIVGGEVDFEQPVKSMQIQKEKKEKAKKGDDVGIKVKKKVRKGYKVFKV
jgi:translation elongation factor EF-1alpha